MLPRDLAYLCLAAETEGWVVPFSCDCVHSGFEWVAAHVGVCARGVAREEAEEAGGEGLCERDEGGGGEGGHPGGLGWWWL